MKTEITYDGLKQVPSTKESVTVICDTLKRIANRDTGHLSDMACHVAYSANELNKISKELFDLFNEQKQGIIKQLEDTQP